MGGGREVALIVRVGPLMGPDVLQSLQSCLSDFRSVFGTLPYTACAGEKLWQLPLEEEYWELCKSPIADMSNIGGRFGGSITAALFLKQYVDFEKVCACLLLGILSCLLHPVSLTLQQRVFIVSLVVKRL